MASRIAPTPAGLTREELLARKIQAIWRGYRTRRSISWESLKSEVAVRKERLRAELTRLLCTPGALLNETDKNTALHPALLLQRRRAAAAMPQSGSASEAGASMNSPSQPSQGISPLGLSLDEVNLLLKTSTWAGSLAVKRYSTWLLEYLLTPMSLDYVPASEVPKYAWPIRSANTFLQSYLASTKSRPRAWVFSDMSIEPKIPAKPAAPTSSQQDVKLLLQTTLQQDEEGTEQDANAPQPLLTDTSRILTFIDSRLTLPAQNLRLSLSLSQADEKKPKSNLPPSLAIWINAHRNRELTGAFFPDLQSFVSALQHIAKDHVANIIPRAASVIRRLTLPPAQTPVTPSSSVAVAARQLTSRSLLLLALTTDSACDLPAALSTLPPPVTQPQPALRPGNFVVTAQPGVYASRVLFSTFPALCQAVREKIRTMQETTTSIKQNVPVVDKRLKASNTSSHIVIEPPFALAPDRIEEWLKKARETLVTHSDKETEEAFRMLQTFDDDGVGDDIAAASIELCPYVKRLLNPALHGSVISTAATAANAPASQGKLITVYQLLPELTLAILVAAKGSRHRALSHLVSLNLTSSTKQQHQTQGTGTILGLGEYYVHDLINAIALLDYLAEKCKIKTILQLVNPCANVWATSTQPVRVCIDHGQPECKVSDPSTLHSCHLDRLMFSLPRCQLDALTKHNQQCPLSPLLLACYPLCFNGRITTLTKRMLESDSWKPVRSFEEFVRLISLIQTTEHEALLRADAVGVVESDRDPKSSRGRLARRQSEAHHAKHNELEVLTSYLRQKSTTFLQHGSTASASVSLSVYKCPFYPVWGVCDDKRVNAAFLPRPLISPDPFTILTRAVSACIERERKLRTALNLRQALIKYQQAQNADKKHDAIPVPDPLSGLTTRERKEKISEIEKRLKTREHAKASRRALMNALQPGNVSFFSNCTVESLTITARDLDAILLTCRGSRNAVQCIQRLEENGAKFSTVAELLAAVVAEQRKRDMLEFLLSADPLEDGITLGFRAALSKRYSPDVLASIADDVLSESEDEEFGAGTSPGTGDAEALFSEDAQNADDANLQDSKSKPVMRRYGPKTPCLLLKWRPLHPRQVYEARQKIEEKKQAARMPLAMTREEILAATFLASADANQLNHPSYQAEQALRFHQHALIEAGTTGTPSETAMSVSTAAGIIARVSEMILQRERVKREADQEICDLERRKITLDDIDFICEVAGVTPLGGYSVGAGDVFRASRKLNRRVAMYLSRARGSGPSRGSSGNRAEIQNDPRFGSVLELALAVKCEIVTTLCSRLAGDSWSRLRSRVQSEQLLTSQFAPLSRTEAQNRYEAICNAFQLEAGALSTGSIGTAQGVSSSSHSQATNSLVVFQPHTLEQCLGGRKEAHFQLKASLPIMYVAASYGNTSLEMTPFDAYMCDSQNVSGGSTGKDGADSRHGSAHDARVVKHTAMFGPEWTWTPAWNILDWIPLQHTFPSPNSAGKLPDIPPLEALVDVAIQSCASDWCFSIPQAKSGSTQPDARAFDRQRSVIVPGHTGLTWLSLTSRSALPSAVVARAWADLGSPSSVTRIQARHCLREVLSYPTVSAQLFGHLGKPVHLSDTHLDLLLFVSGGVRTPPYSNLRLPGAVIAVLAAVRAKRAFTSFDALARYTSAHHERYSAYVRCASLLRSKFALDFLWSPATASRPGSEDLIEARGEYRPQDSRNGSVLFSLTTSANSLTSNNEPSTSRYVMGNAGAQANGVSQPRPVVERETSMSKTRTSQRQSLGSPNTASYTSPSGPTKRPSSPSLSVSSTISAWNSIGPNNAVVAHAGSGAITIFRAVAPTNVSSTSGEMPIPKASNKLPNSVSKLILRQHLLKHQENVVQLGEQRAMRECRPVPLPELSRNIDEFLTETDLIAAINMEALLGKQASEATENKPMALCTEPSTEWTDFLDFACFSLGLSPQALERILRKVVMRQRFLTYSVQRSGGSSRSGLSSPNSDAYSMSSKASEPLSASLPGTSSGAAHVSAVLQTTAIHPLKISTKEELLRLLELEVAYETLRYLSVFALPSIAPAGSAELVRETTITLKHSASIARAVRHGLSAMWRRIRSAFVRNAVLWRSRLSASGVNVDGLRLRMRREDEIDLRLAEKDLKGRLRPTSDSHQGLEEEEGPLDAFSSLESRLNATFSDEVVNADDMKRHQFVAPNRFSVSESLSTRTNNRVLASLSDGISHIKAKQTQASLQSGRSEDYPAAEAVSRARILANAVSAAECLRNEEWRAIRAEWTRLRTHSERLTWELTPCTSFLSDEAQITRAIAAIRQRLEPIVNVVNAAFTIYSESTNRGVSLDLSFTNDDDFLQALQTAGRSPALLCRILDAMLSFLEAKLDAMKESHREGRALQSLPSLLSHLRTQAGFIREVERKRDLIDLEAMLDPTRTNVLAPDPCLWPAPAAPLPVVTASLPLTNVYQLLLSKTNARQSGQSCPVATGVLSHVYHAPENSRMMAQAAFKAAAEKAPDEYLASALSSAVPPGILTAFEALGPPAMTVRHIKALEGVGLKCRDYADLYVLLDTMHTAQNVLRARFALNASPAKLVFRRVVLCVIIALHWRKLVGHRWASVAPSDGPEPDYDGDHFTYESKSDLPVNRWDNAEANKAPADLLPRTHLPRSISGTEGVMSAATHGGEILSPVTAPYMPPSYSTALPSLLSQSQFISNAAGGSIVDLPVMNSAYLNHSTNALPSSLLSRPTSTDVLQTERNNGLSIPAPLVPGQGTKISKPSSENDPSLHL